MHHDRTPVFDPYFTFPDCKWYPINPLNDMVSRGVPVKC